MPADPDDLLDAIHTASQRVAEAETQLADARLQFRESVRRANAAGVSLSRIASALGVSRQRVQQIRDR